MGLAKQFGQYHNAGPPLERVPRVHRHPSILGNGCQAPVLKCAGTHLEVKAGAHLYLINSQKKSKLDKPDRIFIDT